jgi:glycosyltransferase involved in cell wall biosynthesis
MRVLIATSHRGVVGGVETYLRRLLPDLLDSGIEVGLLCEHAAQPGSAIDEAGPGIPIWQVEMNGWLEQVDVWRPDVVYSQGLESPHVEQTLLGRYPSVLFAHNYHGTCISGTKRFAWPHGQPCDRELGIGCLWRYLPRGCGGLNPVTMLKQFAAQRSRRDLLCHYRAVLVASRHMQTEYRRHGVPADRLQLLPLFPSDICPDASPPSERGMTGKVLMVGRLTELKGGCLLVGAIRLAQAQLGRPLELVVAGDGPERGKMENLARQSTPSARFVGWVNSERRTALMREADVLAVPSLWPEPFGLVGIEAGCVGLPAVAFAVGGIPDWLEPGVSGESSRGLTATGMADALTRVLREQSHWRRLRRGAWEMSQRFSREAHVGRLLTMFHSCVQEAVAC